MSLLLLLQICIVSTALSICAATLLGLPAVSTTSLLWVTAWERAFLVPGRCLLYSGGVCGDPELWDEAVCADDIKEVQRPEGFAEHQDHLQHKPLNGRDSLGQVRAPWPVAEEVKSVQ